MKQFKDFNIQTKEVLIGEKISIHKVLNRPVIVISSRVTESKFSKNNSKCLALQIELEGAKRVLFSGSQILIKQIEQVPEGEYPFETEIIKQGEHFEFT